jgi:hypothetical protein
MDAIFTGVNAFKDEQDMIHSTMTIAVIETVCKNTFNPQLRSSANVDENTFDQIRLEKQYTQHSLKKRQIHTIPFSHPDMKASLSKAG